MWGRECIVYSGTPKCGHPEIRTSGLIRTLGLLVWSGHFVLSQCNRTMYYLILDTSLIRTLSLGPESVRIWGSPLVPLVVRVLLFCWLGKAIRDWDRHLSFWSQVFQGQPLPVTSECLWPCESYTLISYLSCQPSICRQYISPFVSNIPLSTPAYYIRVVPFTLAEGTITSNCYATYFSLVVQPTRCRQNISPFVLNISSSTFSYYIRMLLADWLKLLVIHLSVNNRRNLFRVLNLSLSTFALILHQKAVFSVEKPLNSGTPKMWTPWDQDILFDRDTLFCPDAIEIVLFHPWNQDDTSLIRTVRDDMSKPLNGWAWSSPKGGRVRNEYMTKDH